MPNAVSKVDATIVTFNFIHKITIIMSILSYIYVIELIKENSVEDKMD